VLFSNFLLNVYLIKNYPCLCLCFGLEQTIIIRFRLRINRQLSQILRTEARTFILYSLFSCNYNIKKEKSFFILSFLIDYIFINILIPKKF
jgi:hypothetical protein